MGTTQATAERMGVYCASVWAFELHLEMEQILKMCFY